METMPRPRPPFLNREVSRHGKVVWYVRKGDGPRIRIPGEYGSETFWAAYHRAVAGAPVEAPARVASGSFRWLLEKYRRSAEWRSRAPATQYKYDKIYKQILGVVGDEPLSNFTRENIIASREARAHTPNQARHFLDAMRGLFGWAVNSLHLATDPTQGVKNPPKKKTKGFPVWTEADVAAYEAHWPVGTRERVWLDVLLYTGLRRGDAARIGPCFVHDDAITLMTEKSGEQIEVTIPILPALANTLAIGPIGRETFVCGQRGKPFTKEGFGNAFSKAARAAGVEKSAHGLRKTGATRAAENGATVAELEAIFGWSGGGMASLYTRAADRKRLSKAAISKLAKNKTTSSNPAPLRLVRGGGEK